MEVGSMAQFCTKKKKGDEQKQVIIITMIKNECKHKICAPAIMEEC
jgi:hypothetical protein